MSEPTKVAVSRVMTLAVLWFLVLGSGCTTTYRQSQYGLQQMSPKQFAIVETARPTFTWKPLSETVRPDLGPVPMDGVSNVTYELRVYDWKTDKLVYSKRDIQECKHTLPMDLEHGVRYRWTVRPWFELSGKKRVWVWSSTANSIEEAVDTGNLSYERERFLTFQVTGRKRQ
jgi:hypothetical protein